MYRWLYLPAQRPSLERVRHERQGPCLVRAEMMSSARVALPAAPAFDRWRLAAWWRRLGPASRHVLRVAALVVAYYIAAHVGYAFGFSGAVAAIVWLPVGVGVAFLYLGGMWLWPGVVFGDLLVNNYSTLPMGSALGQSFGNLVEVVLAAALLRRLCPRDAPISTVRRVVGMVVAIACGTLVSAIVGSLSSWLGGVIAVDSVVHVWRTWWLGDFCGALIVVPVALSWGRPLPRPWRPAVVLEGALTMVTVAGISVLALTSSHPVRSLVFPALIWAAVRFGPRGATLAITIISGIAIWATTHFFGPFGFGSIDSRVLDTQLFIAGVSLSALVSAALVSERERLTESVRRSRARLVAASDEARQQLERDLHDGAQQGLLGLRLRLAQAAETIPQNPTEGQRLVEVIGRQTESVLHDLRSLAQGVYPPLLRDHGLVDAIKSVVLHSPNVSVRATGVGRYSQVVEAAVYFSCVEALQNVAKHAGNDARTEVRLLQQPNSLSFEVIDSGVGFDAGTAPHPNGLANMRDRVEAVGGTLTVSTRRGNGTTVRGRIPIN